MEMQDRKDQSGGKSRPQPQKDFIQKITGGFGKYQLLLCLLIFMSKFPVAFHQMAIIFLAPRTSYTCEGGRNETCPCPNPTYDTSVFTNTIVMEWNLICDQRWLTSFTQTIFQLGTLLGSVFFGMASDRFGRKFPMIVAVIIQVSMGVGAAYAPDYWTFTILRFIVGMSVGGTMVIGFVIVMEFVGVQYRDIISALYQVPFNLGHMLLPVFGYFIRDYSRFQLAISAPVVILLSYYFLLPETPRWLIVILACIPEGSGSVVCASIGVVASFIVFVVVYLYCSELFPTVVRNAALGFSSMSARVGSMMAPFVIELRDVGLWVPPVVFAVFPLVAAFISFLLRLYPRLYIVSDRITVL